MNMTIKTILYIIVVPLSIFALDSLNLNNKFKKNHEFQVKLLYFFSFNTMDQLLDFRDRLLKREKQTMVKPPASCLGKIFSIGGIYIEPYFLSLSFRTYYRLICVMSSLNSVQSRINSYSALFLSSSQK